MNRIHSVLTQLSIIHRAETIGRKYEKCEFTAKTIPLPLDFMSSENVDTVVRDADRILSGEYQIFNYPQYMLSDWLRDPVTGKRIPKSLCSSLIRISDLVNKTDAKNYWEQGHLHPLLTLSQAYIVTGQNCYATKAIALVEDFISANPCGKTIQWKCCMDVAIRLANIVTAMSILASSEVLAEKAGLIGKCVAEHLIFISEQYENTGKYPNNHYLSDLSGVLFGAVFLLRNYRSASCENDIEAVYSKALDLLSKEVRRQINPDGFDYEHSSYYHCFVTELLAETAAMLKRNGMDCPQELTSAITKMLHNCNMLGAFNEGMPLIGDQDGSRLFLLTGCFDINRCDFSQLLRYETSDDCTADSSSAGIYIFEKNAFKVFFKCGNIGTGGKGTHDHNDQLSICVFINARVLIADSGTYVYSSDVEKRNQFRSTNAHSTVYFDGQEQNDIHSDLFSIRDGHGGTVLRKETDSITGQFLYPIGITHERTVSLAEPDTLVVEDRIEHDENNKGYIRLIFPFPKERLTQSEQTICVNSEMGTVTISFNGSAYIGDKEISLAYGTVTQGSYADISIKNQQKFSITIKERHA